MKWFPCRFIALGLALVLVFAVGARLEAKDFPSKNIKLIVPFAPGGGTDLVGRAMASVAPTYFPVALQIICMPGAGGAEGPRFVARAKPDGYTLLYGTFGPVISKPILEDVGYSPKDFCAVVRSEAPEMGFATHKDKWNTLEEFLKDAKANPGKYTYSSSGAGGAQHFPMEILQRVLGIKLIHVPYDGGSPALMALMGGHVDLNFGTMSSILPAIKTGKVKVLAHSGEARFKKELAQVVGDIPTFKELGYDFTWTHWRGILAPAKTPDEVVSYLQDKFMQIFKDTSFQALIIKLGAETDPMGADKFGIYLEREYKGVEKVAAELGLIKK